MIMHLFRKIRGCLQNNLRFTQTFLPSNEVYTSSTISTELYTWQSVQIRSAKPFNKNLQKEIASLNNLLTFQNEIKFNSPTSRRTRENSASASCFHKINGLWTKECAGMPELFRRFRVPNGETGWIFLSAGGDHDGDNSWPGKNRARPPNFWLNLRSSWPARTGSLQNRECRSHMASSSSLKDCFSAVGIHDYRFVACKLIRRLDR